MNLRHPTVLVALCACAGACAVTPPPAPQVDLPAHFAHGTPDAVTRWPTQEVLADFGSAELDALLARAERDSPDLESAVARVAQAEARSRQARAGTLPTLDAIANGTGYAGGARGANAHEIDWAALLSANYEVDFWGKNRAAAASARALAEASRADLATARISVAGAIAALYFDAVSLRERADLAAADLAAAERLLGVVEARYAAGRVSEVELAAQRATVASAQIALAELRGGEPPLLDTLAVLVGVPPEELHIEARSLAGLREPALVPGLPTALMARRPDVIAAEDALAAAHADVQVARAALLPNLDLTVSGGAQNPAVAAAVITLAGAGYSFTAGATLVQSIFDGGRRRAVIAETEARREELLGQYRRAVLAALSETEDALARIDTLDAERDAEARALAETTRQFAAAQARFDAGAGAFRAVLDAERAQVAARDQAARYRLERLRAYLNLAKALGGGWQPTASATASTAPRSGSKP